MPMLRLGKKEPQVTAAQKQDSEDPAKAFRQGKGHAVWPQPLRLMFEDLLHGRDFDAFRTDVQF